MDLSKYSGTNRIGVHTHSTVKKKPKPVYNKKSRKGVSNKQCCVEGCKSKKTENVTLHRFPHSNEEYMKYWVEQLQIVREVNKYMLVCSQHFVAEDFYSDTKRGTERKNSVLKKDAIPSQKLPPPYLESLKNAKRKPRTKTKKSSDADEQIVELKIEDDLRPTTFIIFRKGIMPDNLPSVVAPESPSPPPSSENSSFFSRPPPPIRGNAINYSIDNIVGNQPESAKI